MKKKNPSASLPPTTDCGQKFAHAPHSYRTERGKFKACDGGLKKRENKWRGRNG